MSSTRPIISDYEGISPGTRRTLQLLRRMAKGVCNQIDDAKENPADYGDVRPWMMTFQKKVIKRSAGAFIEFVDEMDQALSNGRR